MLDQVVTWLKMAQGGAKSADESILQKGGCHRCHVFHSVKQSVFSLTELNYLPMYIHVCPSLIRVQLFATPETVAHQDPLAMKFSRQEYSS